MQNKQAENESDSTLSLTCKEPQGVVLRANKKHSYRPFYNENESKKSLAGRGMFQIFLFLSGFNLVYNSHYLPEISSFFSDFSRH